MELSEKQKVFCEEYLNDLNATQAAIRAGYSVKSANAQAGRLLSKASIQGEIDKLRKERSNRTNIEADRVLKELARIGFADPRKILDKNGNFLPVSDWPDDIAAVVSSIDQEYDKALGEIYIKKVRFWNKNNALEQIGRHLGMFNDKESDSNEPRRIAADIRIALAEIDEKTGGND